MWGWHPRESIGSKILLGRTTPSQNMTIWACMSGIMSRIVKKHCETCLWRVGTFWGTSYLNYFSANIGEKVSNWRFNNLFHDAWCLIGFVHHLHPFYIYNLYNHGVWVLVELDFLGPLYLTICHNWYVLVMIEHFSKWIELFPFWDKSNEMVVYVVLDQILNKFGASTKVFMN
jgi:hypothetical protein